jgi:hypothetical protein
MIDLMAAGHLPVHKAPPPPPPGEMRKLLSFESILEELSELATLMRRAVTDGKGELKDGVALREVRETATVSATLLSLVARNREIISMHQNISVIQAAIVHALKDLDHVGREKFLESFDQHVELLLSQGQGN